MIKVRAPRLDELEALTELCLKSKAHWGYDEAFMNACREELTWHPSDLSVYRSGLIADARGPQAVVQVGLSDGKADLEKLFVDPDAMGLGLGRLLFDWAVRVSRSGGADRLMIEADPDAASFYKRMGALEIGSAPSVSIPGRHLPLLEYRL